jgi:anaerobic magnesium-protoporphyrin IX monomethyl ester cyclase
MRLPVYLAVRRFSTALAGYTERKLDMKEKILVINPPGDFFPLGMAYVLACLESHGIDFDFADAKFGNEYKKLLKKNDYYAVATGGLMFHYRFYDEVFRSVREMRPDIPVILGGNITKDMQSEFLFDKLHITYGIVGEAETSLPFLIDAIAQKKSELDAIPGLLYKDIRTGEIKRNPIRRLDLSTDDILPAWHRFNVDYYINNWDHGIYRRRLSMPMIASRGCTGTCTFCSPSIGSYHKRPLSQVIREIEILGERYTFDWIFFVSEMFYPTREEVIDFCEAYKSVKRRKQWTCELRVDADIDIDTFRLMKSVGCVAVVGGVESGSNKILSLMNKRTTREMIIRFFRTAEAAGLPAEGSFLVGNEGETEAQIKETVDMVTSEKMRVKERLPVIYPGTKIYAHAVKRGLIGDEWEYLQRLNFTADIWDYSWSKKDYVNISDIPSDRFWDTIIEELRRFTTFNLTHFVPRDMTYSFKFGMLIKVTGNCAECGNAVTFITPRKMLGIKTFCRHCFRTVEFNLYNLPDFSGHYRFLCAELQKTNKMAVAGTKAEASYLLQYDYFKLNYRSLIAFVEIDKKASVASGLSDFHHLPRISMESLPNVQPDTLLIVDDQFGDVELKIRKFYLKKNLQPPRILHLLPDNKRPYARLLRLVRRHPAATILNKCLVFPAIQLPILIAETKAWFLTILKSHYDVLNRNAFIRMLLEKVQLQR